MKELSPLKVFASYYVDLQENMSNNEKGQIRTFIQSASLHQVIALLTEGKMRTIKPIEESLLESSFANSGMGFLTEVSATSLYNDVVDTMHQHGISPARTAKHIVGSAKHLGQDAIDKMHASGVHPTQTAKQIAKSVQAGLGDAESKFKHAAGEVGEFTKTEWDRVSRMVSQGHLPELNKPLAAVALAALVLTAGYAVYRKYFSRVSQACNHKTGSEKDACIKKFKKDAIEAQITTLTKGRVSCKKSKNPGKCVEEINKKIKTLHAKIH